MNFDSKKKKKSNHWLQLFYSVFIDLVCYVNSLYMF